MGGSLCCQVQETSRSLLLPSTLLGFQEAERFCPPPPPGFEQNIIPAQPWVGGNGKEEAIWEGPSCEQTAELGWPLSLQQVPVLPMADLHGGSDGVAMGTTAVLGVVLL